jgi:trk system potassium uptake protein TrkH
MRLRSRLIENLSLSVYPVASFLILILAGAVALRLLPMRNGQHLSFIDALFMSTSPTCVTGLSVVDIGKEFTLWGQLTILALIQLGGLGIMTLSTALLVVLGRSLSFRSRFAVQDTYAHTPQVDVHVLLRNIILFTFSFEALGSVLLFVRFREQFDTATAWYYAIFHAISAFCNAGFGLFSDSLMSYRGDVLVNLTIAGLIIMGGIGFVVLHELVRAWRSAHSLSRYWNQLSLHNKMVLSVTAFLLAFGMLFFLLSEWSTTLKDLPLSEKLLAAFFQSVTPRTAGFNTLDYGSMNNITLLGTIVLMFIGASPGSTGGGVKTSTLGVFLALIRAHISGSEHVHAFKRSISEGTINRAFGIFIVSTVIIMLGAAGLLISEVGAAPYKESQYRVIEIIFEVTSAFGTVGLSTGLTPNLTAWGKFILVVIMYTGRLGPLVLAVAIRQKKARGQYIYAEEQMMIG